MQGVRIRPGEESTLFGMNGGCPESKDGKRVVYAVKADLTKQETDIYVSDVNFQNERKVFSVHSGNHNGPSASFIDNSLIVFRDGERGKSVFRIMNVDTGEVLYKIFAKESHCAEGYLYPFSISSDFKGFNPDYPEIDEPGIYVLNIKSGEIKMVASEGDIIALVESKGMHANESTGKVSHVQLSPDGSAVMMRIGVEDCPVFGALGCFDIETKKGHIIPDKPVHQLWYDNETYMATRQFNQGKHIEMETSYLARFTKDGEELEVLGGIGNHMDGSPDRRFFTGDRCYPGFAPNVYLYKKGDKKPIAEWEIPDNEDTIWGLKVHPNPCFSRDGKRLYFNCPRPDNGTDACYVDISEYVK